MKTKLLRSTKYAFLLLSLLLIGYSCSDSDPVQQIDYNETQWENCKRDYKESRLGMG